MRPYIDDLVVALIVGDEAHGVVVHHLLHLLVTLVDVLLLLLRDDNITEVERQAASEGHIVTEVFDIVEELRRTRNTALLDHLADDSAQALLRKYLVDITDLAGHKLVDKHAAHRSVLHKMLYRIALLVDVVHHYRNRSVERHTTLVVGYLSLLRSVEFQTLALVALAELGDVIQTEHHVLRRHGDRRSVGGVEDVV